MPAWKDITQGSKVAGAGVRRQVTRRMWDIVSGYVLLGRREGVTYRITIYINAASKTTPLTAV